MSNPVPRDRDRGDDEKFLCLLSRYLDRLTTPEEEAAMVDVLRRSEPRRQCFVEYCRHVAMLQELVSKRSPADILSSLPDTSSLSDLFVNDADAARKDRQRSDQPAGGSTYGFLSGAAHGFGTLFTDAYRLGSVLVIAAMMFALGLLAAPLGHWQGEPGSEMSRVPPSVEVQRRDADIKMDGEDSDAPSIAARFVRGVDAVWDKSSGTLDVGAPLEADRVLSLRRGTAEIAFDSGARVLLKGPAQFELSSPMAGVLHYGRLATEVPEEARGFVVETPRASIVDYGTSFFLHVDPENRTEEAFVEKGEIHVGVNDNEDAKMQAARKKLFKGQGVRIDDDRGGNSVMHEISMPSRRTPSLELSGFQPTLPNEIGGLRLWLRADAGVCQDVDGTTPAAPGQTVARWIDQSGSGLSPRQSNATYRPRLVAINGRFALRFDAKWNQRLEEPNQTGPLSQVLDPSDQGRPRFTMCAVFSVVAVRMPLPQTLFSQFPNRSNHTSRYFGIRDDRLFYSEYPPVGIQLASAGGTIAPSKTYVAVLTRNGDMESIYLNGKVVAWSDQAEHYAGNDPCRWWIGGRYLKNLGRSQEFFGGDLFEFIVFSRPLSKETRESMETYLINKYVGKSL